jgi:hypothetical protein
MGLNGFNNFQRGGRWQVHITIYEPNHFFAPSLDILAGIDTRRDGTIEKISAALEEHGWRPPGEGLRIMVHLVGFSMVRTFFCFPYLHQYVLIIELGWTRRSRHS